MAIQFVTSAQTVCTRKSERQPAEGTFLLLIDLPGATPIPIPAKLMDISKEGFRARHMYSPLSPGATMTAYFNDHAYTVQLIWTRIENDGAESGFRILH